jgi:DNA-binding CsgD family transcriptional regulator
MKRESIGGEGKNRSSLRREKGISKAEIARQLGIGTSGIKIAIKKKERKVN